ncbi:MAG: DUF3783 domain-containing protein [Clostridia bacterium]|nr:DUF3783 domain-containing protein [Clostridia bacterium]
MKAIPRKPKPRVLAFNVADERLEALKTICETLDISLANFLAAECPEAFSLTLGDLLERGAGSIAEELTPEEKLAVNALTFPEEMIYLADLPGDLLDAFLMELRKTDLRVPLKAVATPTNASWKPMSLKLELMEEHAAMQAAIAAQKVKAAEDDE